MSVADDEDEDSTNIGITRYPCMPSLVALQQMRNRLHLAHLGKKLMKWTALATGKELRKTAKEIVEVTDNLANELHDAFIILARCRYFYPSINDIILQDVGSMASITVEKSFKTAACVKVLVFDIVEAENDPYPHLGIGQGGQTVRNAKDAWLALLKKLIIILQLRLRFQAVEAANKAATKKSNVLGKVVIPRTVSSINYILSELEEMAREEFFRMKKIIQVKTKKSGKGDVKKPEQEASTIILEPIKEEVEYCATCDTALSPQTLQGTSSLNSKKLEDYNAKLTETTEMTKDMIKSGILSPSVTKVLKDTEKLQQKVQMLKGDIAKSRPEPENICEDCKKELQKKKIQFVPPSVPKETAIKSPLPSADSDFDEIYDEELTSPCCNQVSPKPSATDVYESFESEVKEIVKIIRVKNPDGTITEEKKTIKMRKEVRTPGNAKSNEECCDSDSDSSCPYQTSRTVGLATVCQSNIDFSIALSNESAMEVETHISSLNECLAFNSTSLSINDEFDIDDIYSDDCKTKYNLMLNDEIENNSCFYEPSLRNESATSVEDSETILLTDSDRILLVEMKNIERINIRDVKRTTKSNNEINKKQNNCGHSVS